MESDSDFHEAFLKSNANLEFISLQFADVIRDLMRAAVASDGGAAAVSRAARQMKFVVDLLSQTEEKFGFHHIFQRAISDINIDAFNHPERDALIAAQDAVKYLVESSCHDAAARGRASRRLAEFYRAIPMIEDGRLTYELKKR